MPGDGKKEKKSGTPSKGKKPSSSSGSKRPSSSASSSSIDAASAPAAAAATVLPTPTSGEAVDLEVRALEAAFQVAGGDDAGDLYSSLPDEVFVSFDKLQAFARQLNASLPTPEFVLVGPAGAGKTALLEAIIGGQVATNGSATSRPVHYNLVNNLEAGSMKITVKRDLVSKSADKEVSFAELGAEIALRSQKSSDTPILVNIELKNTCSMTIIDTPGLDGREELALAIARPNHRRVIAVESTQEWSEMSNVSFVKKFDPELSRTIFVYTNFQNHLQSFTNTREVNKFLSGVIPEAKTYFITIPSAGVRARFTDTQGYRTKIAQAVQRDLNSLEQLQFDKRHEPTVGLGALRKHVLALTWKSYQTSVPQVLKQLRQKKKSTLERAARLEKELQAFDSSKLRSLASNHVVDFLQVLESLIAGTSQGNPSVNGQTLEEEKNAHGEGDWVDMYNRVIRFDPHWSIPYWDNKIYGGQQFERLLSEFQAVAKGREIVDLSGNDVATAAGINKLNNVPNYAWAAADLAQQKSQDAFMPLIEQLTNRAIYIVKRLTEIAEKIIDARRKERAGNSTVDDVGAFPYFTFHVKDVFYKFVDQVAKDCHEKCMDEFYSTRTIYWDLTESDLGGKGVPLDRNQQAGDEDSVKDLAGEVFVKLRERITTNILLKFYNFFLVPIQSDLATELQGKVNTMSDEQLEQLFDVKATKQRLEENLAKVQAEADAMADQDRVFLDYANTFSHPVKALSD